MTTSFKNIIAFGINHKTAPIEIREKFYLNPTEQDLILSELKNQPQVSEAFVLSTCNRTEIYIHAVDRKPDIGFITDLILGIKRLPREKGYENYFYTIEGAQTADHLLRVATGLDSLVLGEKQILGQVKTSFARARERAMLGKPFNILSNLAVRTGKMAHSTTEISCGGSSVSWAAVVLVESILGTLKEKSILVIGAGKMSELALNQMHTKGAAKIYLMNRTHENAQALAKQFQAMAVSLFDFKEILNNIDVCICSASAPHYILEKSMMEKVMGARNNRPLVLVDISMPRNIDPQISQIRNISLSYIDDLDKIVDDNMRKRQTAVPQVERIIQQKLKELNRKLDQTQKSPVDQWDESTSASMEI